MAGFELIYSVYVRWPDVKGFTTSCAFYASGFIHARGDLSAVGLALARDWHRVEDVAALQRLFDLAKAAVRSEPKDGGKTGFGIGVETSATSYAFSGDFLKLDAATLPACRPYAFPKDGHGAMFYAMEGESVVDNVLPR
ncbi:MAG TPA: hypothetical protein VF950_08290 [Planctomycetota bacterium]